MKTADENLRRKIKIECTSNVKTLIIDTASKVINASRGVHKRNKTNIGISEKSKLMNLPITGALILEIRAKTSENDANIAFIAIFLLFDITTNFYLPNFSVL